MLKELELHDADMRFDVFKVINKGLSKCEELDSISFSKNMLGDPLVYDDSEMDSDIEDKKELHGRRIEELLEKHEHASQNFEKEESKFMECFAEITVLPKKDQLLRVCLSHCYIGDSGLSGLLENLLETNITYVNFAWNHCTEMTIGRLAYFIESNSKLEKMLLQHNSWGSKKCLQALSKAMTKHQSVKYLDLSAMGIKDDAIKLLMDKIAKEQVTLNTLHCRKNEITFEGMHQLIKKLHNN
jgi:hypothetical protein